MYLVNNQKYEEDPSQKLGGGTEGAVYPFEGDPYGIAVKLFHPTDPDDRDEKRIAQYRAKKVKAITGLNLQLPDQFVIPKLPAEDSRKNVIGYLMRRVPKGYTKLKMLLEPAFRTNNAIGLREIALLYAILFEDLEILGRNRLAVGDVNLGCNMVKISPQGIERAWVDADSWSYPGYPCLATTEMFCHPDLYANLEKVGNQFVAPQPKHDRFAYSVEFCLLALHGAHPFRMGLHPSAQSLQERAEQGITIFDSSVKYPSFLPSPEALSDELLDALIARLKRKTDAPLEPVMLRRFAEELIICPKCNEQYHSSRKHCPKCQEKTVVPLAALLELLIEEFYTTVEAILFAEVIDDTLYLACRVSNHVHIITINERKSVSVIKTAIVAKPGARYRFFDSYLVVCPDPHAEFPVSLEVYRIEGNNVKKVENLTTNGLENEPAVFDASPRFLYRTAGNTLMCGKFLFGGKVFSEDPVAQVHRSQSWFTVDRSGSADHEVIFGYDRALREMQWFVIKGNSTGEKFEYHQVPLPSLRAREKLEDFAVYFNAASVLLVRLTRYQGRQNVRYSIIGLDGSVKEDIVLSDTDDGYSAWEHIHGKLFQKSSILHVTPEGVVKQPLASQHYDALADTRGVITAEDRLFKFGQRIGVARRNAILRISKK